MTEQTKMDIYNFELTSNIPPLTDEPIRRDGYKWSIEKNQWLIDSSQSQTKRLEIKLAQNPDDVYLLCDIFKERQLDGYCQRLAERQAKENNNL